MEVKICLSLTFFLNITTWWSAGLAKSLFGFSHTTLWENPNELFSHPSCPGHIRGITDSVFPWENGNTLSACPLSCCEIRWVWPRENPWWMFTMNHCNYSQALEAREMEECSWPAPTHVSIDSLNPEHQGSLCRIGRDCQVQDCLMGRRLSMRVAICIQCPRTGNSS